MSESVPSQQSNSESSLSLQDRVIDEAMRRANELLSSDDPQIVKAREQRKNQRHEWQTWLTQGKIDQKGYDKLDDAAVIEAKSSTIFDPLTGLLNRNGLDVRLTDLISHSNRSRSPLNLLYIDLEGFKNVNDTLGHDEGDRVLKTTAEFFEQIVRGSDAVARVGGDEFVIAILEARNVNKKLHDGEKRETAQERVTREIKDNYELFMRESYEIDGVRSFPHIGARIGHATYIPGESKADFIKRGDIDMNSKRDPNNSSRRNA